jgi:hypothetical protein
MYVVSEIGLAEMVGSQRRVLDKGMQRSQPEQTSKLWIERLRCIAEGSI